MKRVLCAFVPFFVWFISGVACADDPRLVVESGGHQAQIRGIQFTSDGRYLVSSGYDKVIRVWDARTGQMARTIRGEIGDGLAGALYATALSSDDRYLAVGGWLAGVLPDRHAIRIHDFKTGEVKALLRGHADVINALAFSRDGKYLASGGSDHTVRVWDVRQFREIHVLKGHTNYVYGVGFSPDGQRLVSGSLDDTVRLWEVGSGRLIKEMKGHTGHVFRAAFSPDGKYIASGGQDRTVRLWDARTGDPVKILATQGRDVRQLAFSPDGKLLLAGSGFGDGPLVLNIFSVPAGRLVASFDRHDNAVSAIAISPDGKIVATGGGNQNEIYLWDLRTRQVVGELVGNGRSVFSVGFAQDGRSVAFGQEGRYRSLNDQGPLQHVIRLVQGADYEIALGGEVANQADYFRAVERFGDHELKSKGGDLATLQMLRHGNVVWEVTRDATSGVRHLAYTFTRDGRYTVSGGDKGHLTVYHADTGTEARRLVGHTSEILAVAVSPDNRTVVSGSDDQTVRFWDLESGRNLLTIFVGTDREWVAWTPNGYYTSSVKGDRYVGWHVNHGVYRAAEFYAGAQFQNELYRPDVVAAYLKSRDLDVAVRVANDRRGGAFRGQAAVTPADLRSILPPLVHVSTPDKEESVVASDTVTLKAVALSNTLPITDVKVFLNGAQVVGGKHGQSRGKSDKREIELELTLEPGVNTVTIIASNEKASSDPIVRRVRYTGRKVDERPDLVVLTIGVSEYKNPKVAPLEFAHADAIEVDKVLALQEGRAFKKVKRKRLTNPQATRAEILRALNWLRSEGTQKDYRLLFLSGHGNVDKQGNYYFFSHEHDPDEDWELYSIKWSAILERLDGPWKAILMVDTCRAAAVAGGGRPRNDTNFDEILKQMLNDYRGLVVFSAATGREVSLERREWGHGAFTKALLEGLAGKADGYGGEKDGYIDTKELGSWIIDRVKQLNKEQHATYSQPPGLPSFPLVQVK